jgi:hypothetical protein
MMAVENRVVTSVCPANARLVLRKARSTSSRQRNTGPMHVDSTSSAIAVLAVIYGSLGKQIAYQPVRHSGCVTKKISQCWAISNATKELILAAFL